MHKIKPVTLTAGMVKNDFEWKIERSVVSDNVFSFMSSVKETPTYWKQLLLKLTMVKQIGISTCFMALPCADLRWEWLPYSINKLSNLGPSDEERRNLNYQERFNLLNNNPVLVARYF